jgi:L-asparagine transporter-like permease
MWSSLKKIMKDKERSNEVVIYLWCISLVIVLFLWIFEVLNTSTIIFLILFLISQIIRNTYMIKKKHRQEKNQTDPQSQE